MAGNLATVIAFTRRSDGLAKLLGSIEQVIAIIRRIGNASDANGFERDLFQQVLETARQIFDADVVIMHSIKDGQCDTSPIKAGTLRYEKQWSEPANQDSVVHNLLDATEDLFFFEDTSIESVLVGTPMTGKNGNTQRFVVRESIASSVAIKIHAGQVTRGVLFLDYKTQHGFNPCFKDLVRAFADLVSLCIEISQLYKGAIEIAEDLHTKIIPRLIRDVLTESGLGCIHLQNENYDQAHTYLVNIEAASQRIVLALGDIVRRLITNFTPMAGFISDGSS